MFIIMRTQTTAVEGELCRLFVLSRLLFHTLSSHCRAVYSISKVGAATKQRRGRGGRPQGPGERTRERTSWEVCAAALGHRMAAAGEDAAAHEKIENPANDGVFESEGDVVTESAHDGSWEGALAFGIEQYDESRGRATPHRRCRPAFERCQPARARRTSSSGSGARAARPGAGVSPWLSRSCTQGFGTRWTAV